MTAEIFVLNYNGADLLRECLPSILEASKASPINCPVIVIDNRSTDDSAEVLKKEFPTAKVYFASKNLVLCSFNEAVRQSAAEIVILLNNDLKVEKNFIAPLLEGFEKRKDAFLVAPQAHTFDKTRYEGSLSKIYFKHGLLAAESRFPGYEEKINKKSFTMQAGFGAFKRDTFLNLGGFDDLYLPGTLEDSDLCFRAWRMGYACYYAPESRVYHKGQATFKRVFNKSKILAINQRNLYLFTWKNIRDPYLLLKHFEWLVLRPLFFLLKGRVEFLWGFLWAFGRLPKALVRRMAEKNKPLRSDREIFQISGAI